MTSQRRFLASASRNRLVLFVFTSLAALAVYAGAALCQVDVWVDPGHCCQDPGAKGFDGSLEPPNEMDITFDVTDWLQQKLLSLFWLTYKTVNHPTSFFEPSERGFIANGTTANDDNDQGLSRLLISVHMNSFTNPNTKGTETHHSPNKYFAQDTKTKLNDLLAASYIHPAMMSGVNAKFLGCSEDRHIKNNSKLAILNVAKPPAVLLEVCFISHGCQWNYILQSGTQAFVAQEIAAGASQYLNATDAHIDVEAMARLRAPESELWNRQNPPSRVDSQSSLVSLQEGFEGTTFPPAGWTTQTSGLAPPHAWHRTTDPDDVGSGTGAGFVGSASPSAIDEWLISPVVAIAAPDDAIKFSWAGSKYWSNAINASLSIRQSGTTTWTQLWSLATNEPAADPFIYRERVVDVSAWIGMNVEFGFRVNGTNGASFAIDDVAVGDFIPTSTAPNDVCATATELTGAFSVQGVTCYAANDLDPYVGPAQSCVADHLAGPDVFFEINAAWGDTLHTSLTSDWGGGLYLVDDCLTPVCIVGGYAEDARTSPEIHHRFAPGGTYYLVVDGLQGSCGPFELTGELVPSPTDVGDEGAVPALRLTAVPNPAGGPVTLFGTFPSSRGSPVSVEVYNVEGKKLRHVEGRADAGEFSFTWDHRDQGGTPVASGLYFARLRVGSESVVQKFVILR